MEQRRRCSKRNRICVCSLWAKEKERVVWILRAFWGFLKIIRLFLSLHNIVGVHEETALELSSMYSY